MQEYRRNTVDKEVKAEVRTKKTISEREYSTLNYATPSVGKSQMY